jgi:hypothetical protein
MKSLGITALQVGKPSIFWASAKVGPNLPVSTLGIGLDLIGWIMRPKKYFDYIKICWRCGYYVTIIQFVSFSFLILPLALLCLWINLQPLLGHIAVLKEARGKRRLIGITDFWTQILFRPLHDAIYRELNKLPEDGTRDQSGPILHLLETLKIQDLRKAMKNDLVQSLDLSAATDRLPVDLQVQILNQLGYPGDLWKSVLEREWNSKVGPIKYEVGQPMGAYSSFAMLALTNHVIVHIAKRRAFSPTVTYAVLGDDVAIAGRKISNHYRDILTYLGVEVNPIKGFDGGILEFAKQLWTINGINISPLGAKNILLCIRNPAFLPSILFELWTKRFPLYFRMLPRKEIRLRKKRRVRGIERPFITSLSLIHLVSSLWYKPGKTLEGLGWVKSLLHLASFIGPRSGLWYVGSDVRSYLRGWDYDCYQKLWWGVLKRLLQKSRLQEVGTFDPTSLPNRFVRVGVHSNLKIHLVTKLKLERERRLGTFSVILNSWAEGYRHICQLYRWPFHTLPLIRNWFTFEDGVFLAQNNFIPFIFTISIAGSPSLLIIGWDILKQCFKVVPQAFKVITVRFYRALIWLHFNGFLYHTVMILIILLSLTHDHLITINVIVVCMVWQWIVVKYVSEDIRSASLLGFEKVIIILHQTYNLLYLSIFLLFILLVLTYDFTWTTIITGICLGWHWLVTSKFMKLFIDMKVFWTKHYGIQGRNIVTDITSKVLNPYDGIENLLARSALEYKTDEVPAYKETLSLVKYEPVVRKYLLLIKKKADKKVDRNTIKPHIRKVGS